MMVNNPLQIYAVVIGSKLYDDMFTILAGFGLIYIPLIAGLFESLRAFESGEPSGAAFSATRRAIIGVITFYFGYLLFAVPVMPVNVEGVTYQPVCSPSAVPSSFGNTGTTYDKVFSNLQYNGITLPVGLLLFLEGTSGITNAAMVSLPCQTNVQQIQSTIDTSHLTPQLANQVNRFANECYLPARAKFNSTSPSASSYQTTMTDYGGSSDLNWVGSHVLQTLYYGAMYPAKPVPGFPAGEFPYQYQNYNQKSGVTPGKWGYPTCEQWWSMPTLGLESQIVALANAHSPNNPHLGQTSLSARLSSWWQGVKSDVGLGSEITADDIIARSVLKVHAAQSGFGDNFSGEFDFNGNSNSSSSNQIAEGMVLNNPDGMASRVFAQGGQEMTHLENTIKRRELAMEIPIMQAILLAFLLTLGPIVLIFGKFKMKVVAPYYFLVASTLFVTFIEYFFRYLENSLHASLSYGTYAFGDYSVLYNVFTILYQYGPMLFLMIMGIAGFGVGKFVDSAMGQSVSGSGAGLMNKAVKAGAGAVI